ncbi:hypothetical protein AXK11_00385 [Cephaloticoccus primus]|uniref:TonB-dependent receptor-like beta-barrel domain-containing protein n=1 Tax=Cephaloticoccus primus TaxID=1548207 RepID=A0A139STF1_9BACT|nr:hypothetical protein AXK11_00385 [Cephaloticoccus primus]
MLAAEADVPVEGGHSSGSDGEAATRRLVSQSKTAATVALRYAARAALAFAILAVGAGSRAGAQYDAALDLPDLEVNSPRVAIPEPTGTFAMPVSALRYEPLVDVQGRNLAEGQADIIIRGGVFENTGFRIGAATLSDPQTGHYFAELPIAPQMLGLPAVRTGAANALGSTNVGVGTIAYQWRALSSNQSDGSLSLGAGENALWRGSLYQSGAVDLGGLRGRLANLVGRGASLGGDVDYSRSSSDGPLEYGDHDFERFAGRAQLRTAQSQTDLLVAYQSKFFGWPNLYTPFGVAETENLQTKLAMLNHRIERAGGGHFEASAYYRRNKDDYEYNRLIPGLFNPYLHTSRMRGVAFEGREFLGGGSGGRSGGAGSEGARASEAPNWDGDWSLRYRAEWLGDSLESTSLNQGHYNDRNTYKLTLAATREWAARSGGEWQATLGGAWDDSNRDSGTFSPVVELAHLFPAGSLWRSLSLGYSEATQLPTYTSLNASPSGGLFRGNPDLGRSTSRNVELSATAAGLVGWQVSTAVFHRWDDSLVDWTFNTGSPAARTANAVDIRTTGAELVLRGEWGSGSVTLGYTALTKDADYRDGTVDASFYALNYARQRLTAAFVWRFVDRWELRMDNDARIQAKNALRTTGGRQALRSALALVWKPEGIRGLELAAQVDNLWDSDYQEVPAVPAAGRQLSFSALYRW